MKKLTLTLLLFYPLWLVAQDSGYKVGFKEKGLASFYEQELHGKKVASGEEYDMFSMTAAHPAIPFNSIIKVTNLSNGKWVTLRVNDRGPLTKTRALDVSKRAALKLGMVGDGVVEVELELLKVGDNQVAAAEGNKKADSLMALNKAADGNAKGVAGKSATPSAETKAAPATTKKEPAAATGTKSTRPQTAARPTTTASAKNTPLVVKKPAPAVPLEERFKNTGTYNIWGTEVKPAGYGLQLAAFSELGKALEVAREAKNLGLEEVYIQSGWTSGLPSYRVMYGSEKDSELLREKIEQVEKKGFMGSFVKEHL